MVNLLILNAKGENPEMLLKKLEEFPDASAEFKLFVLETAEKQYAPGELIMIADRIAKEIIAISLSRTETGIDPFALKKSLGFLHKIFLKNPIEKKINMHWELNGTTLEEIKQLDLTNDLIEMMEE